MELKNIDLLRNEYYEKILKVTEPLNNPNIKKLIDFIFWDNAFFWSINQDDAINDLEIDEDFNRKYNSQSFHSLSRKIISQCASILGEQESN